MFEFGSAASNSAGWTNFRPDPSSGGPIHAKFWAEAPPDLGPIFPSNGLRKRGARERDPKGCGVVQAALGDGEPPHGLEIDRGRAGGEVLPARPESRPRAAEQRLVQGAAQLHERRRKGWGSPVPATRPSQISRPASRSPAGAAGSRPPALGNSTSCAMIGLSRAAGITIYPGCAA